MAKREYPALFYEQYALGELDEKRRRELEESPDFSVRMNELARSDENILRLHPPKLVASAVEEKLEGSRAAGEGVWQRLIRFLRRTFFVPVAAPLAALSGLLIVLLGGPLSTGTFAESPDDILIKGSGPHLLIYRMEANEIATLRDQATARMNDLLQISYVSAGERYGVILSVDGRNNVTLHYPANPQDVPILDQSGEVRLDYAYQLDDAPTFERFFFITSNQLFRVRDILQLAGQFASSNVNKITSEITLPTGFEQTSFILRKESR